MMYGLRLFICIVLIATVYIADCRQNVWVKELSISSSVSIRYASVLVRSLVENLEYTDNEVSFQVRIPQEAYITSFVIVTNDKIIQASIKEKNAASEEYNKAKEDGVSAGTVTQQTNVREDIDRNIFDVKVNIAAQTTLEFRLRYEELVQRTAGKYIQKIFVDSDHVIPKLEVTCVFKEKQKFKQLTYQTPTDVEKTYQNQEVVTSDGYYMRKIEWRPSETDQDTQFGLEKPFEIEYELEQTENGGVLFLNDNGEFVHMFSTPCEETKIMMKQIVFIIDISGSMKGDPIKQVRQTMEEIFAQLRSNDYFNIVIFNDRPVMWKKSFQKATQYNIANAEIFVKGKVIADGSTNINDALLKAIGLFSQESEFDGDELFGQIVVFLTDGAATVGVTNRDQIRSNVRKINHYAEEKCCKSTIYTIAFGTKADVDFLRILANENGGSVTVIRETNDDGELLKVYHGVENPYFKNIEFEFMADKQVVPRENLTRTQFLQYDCGDEIVVGGWAFPEAKIHPVIKAVGIHDNVTFDGVPTVRTRNVTAKTLSRLRAYQMVKQLLSEAETATDPDSTKVANEEALKLSLEYGFVTPLTSLVVTDYSPKKMIKSDRKLGTAMFNPQTRAGFSNVQFDEDDVRSMYDDMLAKIEKNLNLDDTNAASSCAYTTSILLAVLFRAVRSI